LFEQREIMDGNLVIGVRADPAGTTIANADKSCGHSPVQVTLVVGTKRIPLPIVEDSSGGMLRTGALVLDVSAVDIRPMKATLEFRATGLERAPRLVRIAPNVLPIFQSIEGQTTNPATGEPDQTFDLDGRGLEFEPGSDPVTVVVSNEATSETWSKTERLDACGPNDKKFALDTVAARISFGNGVNGAVPSLGSTITASYFLSQGQAGNIAANRKWVVHGFSGAFGSNPDATFGGEDPSGWLEQRREARLRLNDGHALVSAADFQQAAVQLPSLEVGRAWMVSPSQGDLQTGTLRLVAMRARTAAGESGAPPESRQWLESIRERLAPRVPLGMRLSVIAPRYVEFTIQAIVEAERRMDPDSVKAEIRAELQRRLTLVSSTGANPARQFGVPVSRQDLSAWIQSLLSVKQALQLSIQVQGATRDTVELSPIGLPRIDLDNSKITVVRSGEGGAA
jgi:predicted phage baseplate assembly protein